MKHLGFRGISNTWFYNYLHNRLQFVTTDGKNSTPLEITCGVPQGSVLGPLLFLIFINDLPASTYFYTLTFADDTTFQMTSNSPSNLFKLANSELQKAVDWFQANKLTPNVKKN